MTIGCTPDLEVACLSISRSKTLCTNKWESNPGHLDFEAGVSTVGHYKTQLQTVLLESSTSCHELGSKSSITGPKLFPQQVASFFPKRLEIVVADAAN